MARVKVLHVINNLRGGGAEEQLRLLLQCLPPDRIESAVWCADARMDFGDLGDEVTVVEAPRRFRWDLRWGALAQFLEEWQPDVVHNWLPATIWTSAVPIRLRSNARFLGAYRNTYSLWSLRRLLQLGGYLFVDQIVSNTAVPGPGYGWMFRRRNGVVIHNAIDMERLSCAKPAGPAGLALKNAVTFLFAARIVGHKNLKVAIDAISALRDEGRRVKLVVCGDGPMRQELMEVVAKRELGD
ncbi:MAG: glycosyltransferase, partial [Candidatus Tectomicrobia bacterium]|nr:glycosyltransferase [Candidatus Tectomicrobia bacterium]